MVSFPRSRRGRYHNVAVGLGPNNFGIPNAGNGGVGLYPEASGIRIGLDGSPHAVYISGNIKYGLDSHADDLVIVNAVFGLGFGSRLRCTFGIRHHRVWDSNIILGR